MGIWAGSLCFFNPPNPPLNAVWISALCWTSCVYKKVSGSQGLTLPQGLMGAWCLRQKKKRYYCNSWSRDQLILYYSLMSNIVLQLVLLCLAGEHFRGLTFITEALCRMKRLAHFLKPQSNELLSFGLVKEVCNLERLWSNFNQDDLCLRSRCPSFCWVKMALMIYTASLGWLMLEGAVVVRGSLPSRPLFHLQLAEVRLHGCRMETWHNKKPNRHVSPFSPHWPTTALT